ncbi:MULTISPECIES: hypothetical protein [unclassified Curtobacterium]|uniref:hypothetical protein n=1 Tax=unclassified Curtobacterium TaxID=257496 RepID=UPI0011B39222|nr:MULTISPECIES: hypothetical protein [unclassified Curtobacterium]WIB69626.1 hypothetical protein DEI85_10650 [Curtobacterium sp. MCBD17_026]
MPDRSASPTLDLQLSWRGAYGRLRVFADRLEAETDYQRETRTAVPMDAVQGWRLGPCDEDAVCVEFLAGPDTYRVLLDTPDEQLAALAIRKVLGPPLES